MMQIDIQAQHFSISDALRAHIERRLCFALSCCVLHIQRIVLRLSDINGPRGGADKRCWIQLTLAGTPDVMIENTEVDLYLAIDRAVHRAKCTVLRKINRQKLFPKKKIPLVSIDIRNPLDNDT
jgi:ribosome-associated translation inhibitor RaiA